MTYGSQAAAASQVFEQQRDLALRDRNEQQLAAVEAALARLDDGTYGTASAAAARSPRSGSRPCPGRPTASTASGSWAAADDARARRRSSAIDAVRAAAATLRGVAIRTPLVPFGRPEARRFLKAESLQPIGAFKIRGAYVAVASLTADERARGVITYSSGNHAQGVARAARLLGARPSSSCRPTRPR